MQASKARLGLRSRQAAELGNAAAFIKESVPILGRPAIGSRTQHAHDFGLVTRQCFDYGDRRGIAALSTSLSPSSATLTPRALLALMCAVSSPR
jgi:hypothetical protein